MNCRNLEDRLDAYLGRTLTDEEYGLLDQHARCCPQCRRLVAAASTEIELPAGERQEFIRSVLERTSGSACFRCRELLCDYADEIASFADSKLIRAHLEHCRQCAALAGALSDLRNELPEMREIEPDPSFTAVVVGRLSALRARPSDRSDRWRDWWLNLVRRPRFSWEAAYVGTLLLVLIFANPLAPSYGALRSLASPDSTTRVAWTRLTRKAPEVWDVCTGKSSQTAAEVAMSATSALATTQRFANRCLGEIVSLGAYPGHILQQARRMWNEWQRR